MPSYDRSGKCNDLQIRNIPTICRASDGFTSRKDLADVVEFPSDVEEHPTNTNESITAIKDLI